MPYTHYPSLLGRTVFISGGSSGIGAELVRAFAAQGSRVALCGTKPGGGDALVAEITAAGHAAPYYEACDVRDIPALQALLARVGARFGPIQVLVNNAGRDDRHGLDELTPDYWDIAPYPHSTPIRCQTCRCWLSPKNCRMRRGEC